MGVTRFSLTDKAPVKSPKGFLDGWNHFLQRWLSYYLQRASAPENMPDRQQTRVLLECARLLTLIGNQGLSARLNAVVPLYRQLQMAKDAALSRQQTGLLELRRQVHDYWSKLYKTMAVPGSVQYCAELAATPWWKKLLHRSAYKALLSRQCEYRDLERQLPAQVIDVELDRFAHAIVSWLTASIRAHTPDIARSPGHIGLALLLGDDESKQQGVVARWIVAQPWESDAPCVDALSGLGTTERAQQVIVWLYQLGGGQPRATLRSAWLTVTEQARPLATILAALSSDRPDFKGALKSGPELPQDLHIAAITAILTGRDEMLLHASLGQWFEHQGETLCDMTIEMSLALCRARKWFDLALAVNPEPHYQSAMGDTLLQFVDFAFRSACAVQASNALQDADVHLIWDALESSRLSLVGLKSPVPDEAWQSDTVAALIAALEEGLDRAEQNTVVGNVQAPFDHFFDWPALAVWKERANTLVFPAAEANMLSVSACGKSLYLGESFVQVYFDPHAGYALRAVWLSKSLDGSLREPELRAFGQAAAYRGWSDYTEKSGKPLDVWSSFLAKSEQFPEFFLPPHRDVWRALQDCAPINDLAACLRQWATDDGVARLIVIWPAVLAQLPLEALLTARWQQQTQELVLDREVSVAHFVQHRAARASGDIAIEKVRSANLDCSDEKIRPHVMNLAAQIGDAFDCHPNVSDEVSCLDVIDDLHRSSEVFLMFHGRYHGEDPRLSELLLGKHASMPVWALAALDTSADFVGLSACESGMTGRAISQVLGPMGIAPAICASGARGVVASLWKCNAEAAVIFWHHLLTQAKSHREHSADPLDWSVLVRNAQVALQMMDDQQADALFKNFFEEVGRFGHWPAEIKAALEQCRLRRQVKARKGGRPYASPYFWAPFIYLGAGRQKLHPESLIVPSSDQRATGTSADFSGNLWYRRTPGNSKKTYSA